MIWALLIGMYLGAGIVCSMMVARYVMTAYGVSVFRAAVFACLRFYAWPQFVAYQMRPNSKDRGFGHE